MINNYHQRFFLALAQHRGNEEEKECIEQNEKVLLRLFSVVPHKAIQGYAKMLVLWMKKGAGLTMMSAKVNQSPSMFLTNKKKSCFLTHDKSSSLFVTQKTPKPWTLKSILVKK